MVATMKRLNGEGIENTGGGMRTQMIHVFVMSVIKCGCAGVCVCVRTQYLFFGDAHIVCDI